ncbi:MAG TPA: hypothetical protein DEH78_06310 [Solibacterales bacterium]|nr:hypothetical protein [Bryobacterales bacterium]
MRAFALVIAAAALLLAQDKDAEQRGKLLDDLERLSTAEAPIFAIDTRLRTAELILSQDPARARRFLDDSLAFLPALSHPPTRAAFEQRAIKLLLPLDPDAARNLATLRPSGDAWDHLVRAALKESPDAAAALASEGLRLGAWPIDSLGELIDRTTGEAAIQNLCLQIVEFFPTSPDLPATEFLVALLPRLIKRHPPAAEEAVKRIITSVEGKRFPRTYAKGVWWRLENGSRSMPLEPRDMIAYRLLSSLRGDAPDLLRSHSTRLARWAERLPEGKLLNGKEEPGTPEDEALSNRIDKMVERSRDKELPAPLRSAVAAEALELTVRLPAGDARLIHQAMLARDAFLGGDDQRATRAAGMLSETFLAVCNCDGPACDSLQGREACAEMIEAFAEYLDEHKIPPESLNLYNPSLKARILLLELKRNVPEPSVLKS